MEPRFSVIIPAYNVAEYIEATLQSVWGQSVAGIEVIVVNDGSIDATAEILARQQDARLKVIHTLNRGVSHVRNTGIAHARGTYLAFLDADDLWYPDHLEKAEAFFSHHPEVMWYAAGFVAGSELSERAGDDEDCSFSLLRFFRSGHMRTWTGCVVLKRSALLDMVPDGKLFPEELSQGEDTVAWMRFAQHHPVLGCGALPTAFYRMREGSACNGRRAAMEKVIEYECRFYTTFAGLEPPQETDGGYWQLRRWELFCSSFAHMLRQASLTSLLPVLREQRRSCGALLALYMGCVVVLFRILSGLCIFPLQAYIRVYRKILRTWPR